MDIKYSRSSIDTDISQLIKDRKIGLLEAMALGNYIKKQTEDDVDLEGKSYGEIYTQMIAEGVDRQEYEKSLYINGEGVNKAVEVKIEPALYLPEESHEQKNIVYFVTLTNKTNKTIESLYGRFILTNDSGESVDGVYLQEKYLKIPPKGSKKFPTSSAFMGDHKVQELHSQQDVDKLKKTWHPISIGFVDERGNAEREAKEKKRKAKREQEFRDAAQARAKASH